MRKLRTFEGNSDLKDERFPLTDEKGISGRSPGRSKPRPRGFIWHTDRRVKN